ncbi:MAG: oxygen-independent coproporphyrinogen-3 oxidase, partial [Saprospiraceae bacterium]
MAGIYLHIPFCKQACHYCNFHFSTSYEKYRDQMLNALVKQLIHDAPLLPSEVNTIYFGGGTPSLLSKSELNNLITTIKMNYKVSQHVEVTLEANPDDVTITKASDWFAAGVNRLSIGVQSFYQEHLSTMNRAHDAKEAENAIHIIKEVGFTNYSVDLMFALPGLTDQMW